MAIYAWATIMFGGRFSNLTHRGIITNGPYPWTKHPAYRAYAEWIRHNGLFRRFRPGFEALRAPRIARQG